MLGTIKSMIKEKISKDNPLWRLMEMVYRAIPEGYKVKNTRFYALLTENFSKEELKDIFFIQIGSNDGVTNDPLCYYIRKYDWSGVMVEPVTYLYEKLVKNYKDQKNIFFENVAISDKDGERNFYRLKETDDELPAWYDQMGSFYLDVVLKHEDKIPNLRDYLITEKVNSMKFTTLVNKHNVKKIDVLHIDAEGYDYEVIKQIDFNQIRPKVIFYEHKHLSDEDQEKCVALLKEHGYNIIHDGVDTLATA